MTYSGLELNGRKYKGSLSDAECSFPHAECDKDILKRVDYQAFSVKYRGTNFELGNEMGPKK